MPVELSERQITDLLRETLADLLEVDLDDVTADVGIQDDLCLESLQQLEFMVRIEQRLGLVFDIEAWMAPRTIQCLARHVVSIQSSDGR